MKILVPTKRVPDPEQKIRVEADGCGVATEGFPFVINPFDAIALEEALVIREARESTTEVIVVGIGSGDYEQQLRTGLAMGADRAVLIEAPEPLDPWNVARVLQAMVQRESPDLVLTGKQGVDDDANQTGQFLAALLDWPQATFASKIELLDGHARVGRETDAGIETVRVPLPAVITCDLRLNEPRYASLPSIMKARKKPIERISHETLGVTIQPRVQLVQVEAAQTARNGVRVANVDELLKRLRDEAKVV
jgi:electron transfer flavoprotein beta subunit